MEKYNIRPANRTDLDRIQEIYSYARRFMAENGNPNQWKNGYPWQDLLEADIEKEQLYVVTEAERICGVFVFALGEDPTYGYMEGGKWRSTQPYGTIHRIAGDGSGGIFDACLEFSGRIISHIRIDTHFDNHVMQHLVEKAGFSRRGVIFVEDGSPRIAYDRI